MPVPATIIEKGVELGQVIGLQLTGELYDWQVMETDQRVGSNSDVKPEASKSNPEELMTDGTDNVEMAVVEADQRVGLGVSIGPRVSKGIAMAMSKTVTEDNIDMEVSIIAERLDITQTESQRPQPHPRSVRKVNEM